MGCSRATGDLAAGAVTQAWLAASEDPRARVTGGYFFHQRPARIHPAASRPDLQDRLIAGCAAVSGVDLA